MYLLDLSSHHPYGQNHQKYLQKCAMLGMRSLWWIISASWISVMFNCEYDIQWEAPEYSRDLIASSIKAQPHSALRASPEPDWTLTWTQPVLRCQEAIVVSNWWTLKPPTKYPKSWPSLFNITSCLLDSLNITESLPTTKIQFLNFNETFR